MVVRRLENGYHEVKDGHADVGIYDVLDFQRTAGRHRHHYGFRGASHE